MCLEEDAHPLGLVAMAVVASVEALRVLRCEYECRARLSRMLATAPSCSACRARSCVVMVVLHGRPTRGCERPFTQQPSAR